MHAILSEAGRFAAEELAPINRPGDRDVLRMTDRPVPVPGPGQVLIRVDYAGDANFPKGSTSLDPVQVVNRADSTTVLEASPSSPSFGDSITFTATVSKSSTPTFPTLPTGLVTFLLTDIENSTALLERLGERYSGLLDDIRGIVRRAVVAAGGREVDDRADEFFAVFERTTPAVEAAVAIQRALSACAWPDDLECRVRVGIHSGRPSLTDTGYVGLSVHTAARVCSSAHGGQIVVSGEARRGMDGSLSAGIGLRSLGRHRMRGLTQPVALFQVDVEGLQVEFPPPRL